MRGRTSEQGDLESCRYAGVVGSLLGGTGRCYLRLCLCRPALRSRLVGMYVIKTSA